MKILITGGFGNVGSNTLIELLAKNHTVSVFELKNKRTAKLAQKWQPKLNQIFWGDIRNLEDLQPAVQGQDAVIHLAAIIPPGTYKHPQYSYEVNVGGMQNIIQAIKNCGSKEERPKLIFTSSVSVHGNRQNLDPPVSVTDAINPSDDYSHHKVECEKLLDETRSEIDWTILRLGVIAPVSLTTGFDPIMFDIGLKNRIETAHGRDVGLALTNAADLATTSDSVKHKIFLIGGGQEKGCQMKYQDFILSMLDAFGVGPIREEAFGTDPYYTDWMDTSESQQILQFQRFSFNDFIKDVKSVWGGKRNLVRMVSPIARLYLTAKSPYLKKQKQQPKHQ